MSGERNECPNSLAGQRYWAHSNHLYSVAALTNDGGIVVERYKYDAYGKQTITNPTGTMLARSSVNWNRGFSGYIADQETGLFYARARYYSSSLGRFVSRDLLRMSRYHDLRLLGMAQRDEAIEEALIGSFETHYMPLPADGYADGKNLYRAYFAPNGIDPSGLATYSMEVTCGKIEFNSTDGGSSQGYQSGTVRIDFIPNGECCSCDKILPAQWINPGAGWRSDNPDNPFGSWYNYNPNNGAFAPGLGGNGSMEDSPQRMFDTWWKTCFYCLKPGGTIEALGCIDWSFSGSRTPHYGQGPIPGNTPGGPPMPNPNPFNSN